MECWNVLMLSLPMLLCQKLLPSMAQGTKARC